MGKFRKTILLHKREHSSLHRSDRSRYRKHNPGLTVLKLLLFV